MFVESFPNNGKPYLRLVESKYVTKSNGKKSCKKVCVLSIGPLDKFDDGKPDYVKRLKESFKNGNPLIPSLLPFVDKKPVRENYDISFKEGDPNCIGHNKLFSNALIERIMEEIGVNSFITRYKQLTNYEFDILGFVRLLIYGRILNPASKISTSNQNNDYFSEVIKDMYKYNIYDTLSFLYDYRKNIINWINNRLKKSFKRTTDIIYYDVTNFFFETENADEDYVDGEGNITKGIRKEGVSKEERHLPIVQMGLFMDEQGLPISIEIFPGNTLDHLTMQKALNNTIDNLNLDRFVFVGDRGMYRGDNTYYLTNHNNGYIITSIDGRNWTVTNTVKTYAGAWVDAAYNGRHVAILRKEGAVIYSTDSSTFTANELEPALSNYSSAWVNICSGGSMELVALSSNGYLAKGVGYLT